jgi:hypothetical protein
MVLLGGSDYDIADEGNSAPHRQGEINSACGYIIEKQQCQEDPRGFIIWEEAGHKIITNCILRDYFLRNKLYKDFAADYPKLRAPQGKIYKD